ncbi:Dolichyl-diphosphooligosaccharide--protein glycosyltransferase subunit Swp1 [Thamnocephalis sphaerospora]|uniref:Ribophorin II n=1 Tax=Thamnocephalis sphaerospora TaxID=78915 RepID=A0A4P9XML3_9FUNG|nr:Dolichyl-diphosphooligosaccharide--protein glycosyltransferase subunit Swp1 [Thamnocephalis sphaerospora]|eukprot:RKP07116.1 Dolichyl-diphosphooligosaccharide--protein glycosyltransferase subunit Swp1 [Thamnocephalis sphaerospora]
MARIRLLRACALLFALLCFIVSVTEAAKSKDAKSVKKVKKAKKAAEPSVDVEGPRTLKLSDFTVTVRHSGEEATTHTLAYPKPLAKPLTVRPGDSLRLAFQLDVVPEGKAEGKALRAHQAFIVFRPANSNASPDGELVQVLESTPNGKHRIELIANRFAKYFSRQPGDFNVDVLLGVFGNVQPVRYPLGTFHVDFPPADLTDRTVVEDLAKRAKQRALEGPADDGFMALPEIEHQFRPDDKMPPVTFSLGFSAVVLSPWFVLVTLWKLAGANPANLPSSPVALLAHGTFLSCLAGFLGLFYLYWTQLRLLQTISYGAILAVVTVLSGRVALSDIAHRRVKATKKE